MVSARNTALFSSLAVSFALAISALTPSCATVPPPRPSAEPGVIVAGVAVGAARVDAMLAADAVLREKPPPQPEQIYPAAFMSARSAVREADRAALGVDGIDCVQWVRAHGGTIRRAEDFRAERPRGARQRCTVDDPVIFGGQVGSVRYDHEEMLMACPLARAMVEMSWILEARDIVEVEVGRPYSCRTIRRRRILSQHAHGLALDVEAMTDSEGRRYVFLDHWERRVEEPVTEEGRFLREFLDAVIEAEIFNIILSPEYDRAHERFLHLDLSPGQSFAR